VKDFVYTIKQEAGHKSKSALAGGKAVNSAGML